ncbi:MAG TPA: DUF1080 domain-containing protein [Phycisphaerales bacterium]|nr:DUF1080 domain-containing protein [Phycisphaerales bacterium]
MDAMKNGLLIAAIGFAVVFGNCVYAEGAELTHAESVAGWTSLFDGGSTDAWRGYKKEGFPEKGWKVEDGTLKSIAGGGGGDIVTKKEYGDFELTLEYCVKPGANSGIIYGAAETLDAAWMTGPEFQIIDDAGNTLKADDGHACGAIYDLCPPSAEKQVKAAGEWNQVRIRKRLGVVEHWLNGMKVAECSVEGDEWAKRIAGSKFKDYAGFGTQSKGHIALQDHGDEVWFRNIRVRALDEPMAGERQLFDGKTMTGWTYCLDPAGKMEDTWSVKNGEIICTGNPAGYIRTKDDFTNYVLRVQWRWNPAMTDAGNSGVLLRMTGQDKVWPKSIEAQLQSGNAGDFWNIDNVKMTTDPARLNGRNTKKVAGNERPVGEWNEYEIFCDGSTVRLYVNGVLANEATDVEVTPGKICLQSEGAEIHFRNVRIAEMH